MPVSAQGPEIRTWQVPSGSYCTYDFNLLGRRAKDLMETGRSNDALKIYLRAVEENPQHPRYAEARRRLEDVNIDHLMTHAA
jgi:hypothetical protein